MKDYEIRVERRTPADPDGQNDSRAEWAREAIACFMATSNADPCDAVADLLTDIRHLQDREPETFGTWPAALATAEMHYEAETDAEADVGSRTGSDDDALIEAFQNLAIYAHDVVSRWESGDLAGAVHGLELALADARDAMRRVDPDWTPEGDEQSD